MATQPDSPEVMAALQEELGAEESAYQEPPESERFLSFDASGVDPTTPPDDLMGVMPQEEPGPGFDVGEAISGENQETTDLFTEVSDPPAPVERANPVRAQVAGLAALQNDDAPSDETGALQYMMEHIQKANEDMPRTNLAEQSAQAAANRAIRTQLAIRNDISPIPKELRASIAQNAANNSREHYQELVATALENAAIDSIEELAVRDPVQAKVLMNLNTPGRMSIADAWRDTGVKQLQIAQLMEWAQQRDDQEGWFQMAYTGILNLFQHSGFSYLGNVDQGVKGFQKNGWRFLTPFDDINAQAEALGAMSAEELAAYLPTLKERMLTNARTGLVENPDKLVETVGLLFDDQSPEDMFIGNAASAFEGLMFVAPGVGMVPYRALKKVGSIPFILTSRGARREAAQSVANSYEKMVDDGIAPAKAETGLDEEDVLDNILPTAINPTRSAPGEQLMTGLSGEANYEIGAVREFMEQWKLIDTSVYTNKEELAAAAQAIADKISARTGHRLIDFEVVPNRHPDATSNWQVVATLGRPDGKGGYLSTVEARGAMENMGLSGYQIDEVGPETTVRTVPLSEEGFLTRGFHATKAIFSRFSAEARGKTTGANSAKIATFLAAPHGEYARSTKHLYGKTLTEYNALKVEKERLLTDPLGDEFYETTGFGLSKQLTPEGVAKNEEIVKRVNQIDNELSNSGIYITEAEMAAIREEHAALTAEATQRSTVINARKRFDEWLVRNAFKDGDADVAMKYMEGGFPEELLPYTSTRPNGKVVFNRDKYMDEIEYPLQKGQDAKNERLAELQRLIDSQEPVDPHGAMAAAWSYARAATRETDAARLRKELEQAIEISANKGSKRHDELRAEVAEEFSANKIYVRSPDDAYKLEMTPYEEDLINDGWDIINDWDPDFDAALTLKTSQDEALTAINAESDDLLKQLDQVTDEEQYVPFKNKVDNDSKLNKLKIDRKVADESSSNAHSMATEARFALDDARAMDAGPVIIKELEKNYKGWVEKARKADDLVTKIRRKEIARKFEIYVKKGSALDKAVKEAARNKAKGKDAAGEDLGTLSAWDDPAEKTAVEHLNDIKRVVINSTESGAYKGEWGNGRYGLSVDDFEASLTEVPMDPQNVGGIIYPVRVKGKFKMVPDTRSQYNDMGYTSEIEKAGAEGYDGVVFTKAEDAYMIDPSMPAPPKGSYDVIAVIDPENVRMELDPTLELDASQQVFLKVKMDIPDTAFLTTPTQPPKQGFLAKWWKTISGTTDKDIVDKAVVADQKFDKLQKLIKTQMLDAFKVLTKEERMWVGQILMKGQNVEKWFSNEEFVILAERAMGKPPTETMIKAYQKYRFNNDVEHAMRNFGVYREKVRRGFESIRFNAFGDEFDIDGIIDDSMTKVPGPRVFNLSDETHHVGENTLTAKQLADYKARGYVKFRTEKPVKLKDGTEISEFIAKKGDMEWRTLRHEQVPYSPGGHRLYADKYFVKQTSRGIQPDTGQAFLRNPNTFATGATIREAREWAQVMDAARLAAKDNKDAGYLDSNIFQGRSGPNRSFPTGEEFLADVQKGKISLDDPFEAVFDREMPSAYSRGGDDISMFVDEDLLRGTAGYHQQLGRMYYSSKGEALRSVKGDLAPTIDPFEAQSQALFNAARLSSSFGDFKTSAIQRWVNTYRDHLNLRDMDPEDVGSTMKAFNNAQPAPDAPIPIRQQMLAQREAIQRILGYESEYDRGFRHWSRSISEWIVGDEHSAAWRNTAGKVPLWIQDTNPIGFLRGWAFDMKLGMFNPGQFFIQTSTMASAVALSPKFGVQSMGGIPGALAYFYAKNPGKAERVLDQLVKNGAHKLAGFQDPQAYKEYIRYAQRTGFFDLGDSHVMVNDMGPAQTFGSLSGGLDAVREMGRFFFYQAEVFNRLVAHGIAYREAVQKFGGAKLDDPLFTQHVAGRAENYSFNMSNTSKAWWQQGLMSIPTQFWAYNVRMIEALTGNNFTRAQKMRLAAMQWGMAGTAGIPGIAAVAEMVKNNYGVNTDFNEDSLHNMLSTVDRGVFDRMVYEITDADILISEKWGTGSWSSDLYKDLFGLSSYNERSTAEMLAGATGSIMSTTAGVGLDLVKAWVGAESGSNEVDLTSDEWVKLFRNISTINNGLKAYLVYNYGYMTSTKGNMNISGLPSQDAAFIAMGFNPQETNEMEVMTTYMKNRSEGVKDAADQIKRWRQEAFQRPDLYEENMKKVNAFVQLLPPDIKRDALKQAHRNTEDSLYTSMVERYDKVKKKEDSAKHFEGMYE